MVASTYMKYSSIDCNSMWAGLDSALLEHGRVWLGTFVKSAEVSCGRGVIHAAVAMLGQM